MASWKGDTDKPVVSICCITYNHEAYIEDALEGFLIQETDFPFEILIHDDASTDRTAEIIRNYEVKYPKIIKSIFQSENKYSQGIRINYTFNISRAKGSFIALCEGDDYWLNKDKLKKQVRILREHDCDLTFHPSLVINYQSGDSLTTKEYEYGYFDKEIKKVSFKEILLKSGNAIPANSILIRKSVFKVDNISYQKFCASWLTHFYWQILGSLRNGAVYIPDHMSVYRRGRPGSWTNINETDNISTLNNSLGFISSLAEFNKLTAYKYNEDIKHVLSRRLKIYLLSIRFNESEKMCWLASLRGKLPLIIYIKWYLLLKCGALSDKNLNRARYIKALIFFKKVG